MFIFLNIPIKWTGTAWGLTKSWMMSRNSKKEFSSTRRLPAPDRDSIFKIKCLLNLTLFEAANKCNACEWVSPNKKNLFKRTQYFYYDTKKVYYWIVYIDFFRIFTLQQKFQILYLCYRIIMRYYYYSIIQKIEFEVFVVLCNVLKRSLHTIQ